MKRLKAPSKRGNDGHIHGLTSATPFSKSLRDMAHRLSRRIKKPKTGKGSGHKFREEGFPTTRRFTAEEVIVLRRRYRNGERSQSLAQEFRMDLVCMCRILHGETYGWVREEMDSKPSPR